jgi:hypothetical protein
MEVPPTLGRLVASELLQPLLAGSTVSNMLLQCCTCGTIKPLSQEIL